MALSVRAAKDRTRGPRLDGPPAMRRVAEASQPCRSEPPMCWRTNCSSCESAALRLKTKLHVRCGQSNNVTATRPHWATTNSSANTTNPKRSHLVLQIRDRRPLPSCWASHQHLFGRRGRLRDAWAAREQAMSAPLQHNVPRADTRIRPSCLRVRATGVKGGTAPAHEPLLPAHQHRARSSVH